MSNKSPLPIKVGIIGSLTESFDKMRLTVEFKTLMTSLGVNNAVLLHGGRDKGASAAVVEGMHGIFAAIPFPPASMLDDSITFNSYLFFVRNKQIINSADIVVFVTDPFREREAEVNPAMEYCNDINKKHHILTI